MQPVKYKRDERRAGKKSVLAILQICDKSKSIDMKVKNFMKYKSILQSFEKWITLVHSNQPECSFCSS